MPWKSPRLPDPEREYLALLSYLPLKRWRGLLRLGNYFRLILRQLRGTRGVVGYSMRVRFLRRQFWTLSVWEDEEALTAFVRAPPHVEAMERLRPFMGLTRFVRWRVRGAELPLYWDDAMQRSDGGTSPEL
jgi:hypothetical protein